MKFHFARIVFLSLESAVLAIAPPLGAQPVSTAAHLPQAELPSVTTLAPVMPHWVFVFGTGGMRIFDGDSGKMQGLVPMWNGLSKFAFDPLGNTFYVTETDFSGIDRTTRKDDVSVYDSHTLKRLAMIPIPPQMLVGSRKQNFVVSKDGKYAFVFSMQPSSSVIVIDLQDRRVDQSIELPGCATLFPNQIGGFSALCADGSLATVNFTGRKPSVVHSAPFFSATGDPIFDNSVADTDTGNATFLSYSGLVYSAVLGAQPKIDKPWSILVAAGLRPGMNMPMDVNWYPGGRQPFAVNRSNGHIYVLMHIGEYWSIKLLGEEVWELDRNAHKLVARHELPDDVKGKADHIEVSQDADPLVFVSSGESRTWVLDGHTFKIKNTIDDSGGRILYVAQHFQP